MRVIVDGDLPAAPDPVDVAPEVHVGLDLVGDWEGTSLRVDAGLGVTATSAGSATMYESAGVILDGSDGDDDVIDAEYVDMDKNE